MIEIEKIKKFLNGDFEEAELIGKLSNGKINITLDVKGHSTVQYNTSLLGDSSLLELSKNNKKLIEYLFNSYLESSVVTGVSYYQTLDNMEDISLKITGSNKFLITLSRKLIYLLPNNFTSLLEQRKRESILDCFSLVEVNSFSISNLDCHNLYSSFTGGSYDEYIIYNALAVKDKKGTRIIPNEEIELIKSMLEILLNKDKVDFDYLEKVKEIVDLEYFKIDTNNDSEVLKEISKKLGINFTTCLEIKLNDKVNFMVYDLNTLKLFRNFLEEYLTKKKKLK